MASKFGGEPVESVDTTQAAPVSKFGGERVEEPAIFYPGAEKSAREIKKTYEQPDYPIAQAEPKEFSKGEVLESAAMGGGLNVVAPKVMQKTGEVLEKVPGVIGRGGAALNIAGRVYGNVPVTSRAIGGTVLGGTADIVGQLGEQVGITGPGRFLLEMGVGTVPALKTAVSNYLFNRVARMAGGFDAISAVHSATKEIANMGASEKKTLDSMAKALGGENYEQGSMEYIYMLVGREGLAEMTAAQNEANRILNTAQQQADALRASDVAQASRILNDANRKAADLMQTANNRLKANVVRKINVERAGEDALKEAQSKLSNIVAAPKELSDIGNELRISVGDKQKGLSELRQTVRDQDIALRNAEIQNKVAKGDLISNTNDILEIVSDLKKLVLREYEAIPVEAPITAKAQVDQVNGLLQALQGVPVRIQNNRVSLPANINPANSGYVKDYIQKLSQLGNLEGKTVLVPPSFEAIDQIRRSLGEAFKGKPPVGYESINKEFAKDLYVKLSKAMGKYSEQHRRFIESYEALSRDLDIFRTKGAKKALALDDYLENNFANDAQGLPAYYFSTPQKVRDLMELTGNKQVVEKAASEYAARLLQGKDSRAVKSWLTDKKNSDWLRELPSVRSRLEQYADQLANAEAKAGKAQSLVSKITGAERPIETTAKRKGEELLRQAGLDIKALTGAEEAKTIEREAAQQVKPLTAQAKEIETLIDQKKSPVDAFAKYILDENAIGNVKKIAQYVAQSEGGEEAFKQAVISTMARVRPNSLAQVYRERIRYALEGSGLYTPQQLLELDRKVAAAREPGILQNLIRGWLVSTTAAETPSRARNVMRFGTLSDPYASSVSDYMGIF